MMMMALTDVPKNVVPEKHILKKFKIALKTAPRIHASVLAIALNIIINQLMAKNAQGYVRLDKFSHYLWTHA